MFGRSLMTSIFVLLLAGLFAPRAWAGDDGGRERNRKGSNDRVERRDRAPRDGREMERDRRRPAPRAEKPRREVERDHRRPAPRAEMLRREVKKAPILPRREPVGRSHGHRVDPRVPPVRPARHYAPAPQRVWVKGYYEIRRIRIWVPGHYREEKIPAVYRTIDGPFGRCIRILIRAESCRKVWVPGHYKVKEQKVWVPGRWETVCRGR
jgi:hypothetical protein